MSYQYPRKSPSLSPNPPFDNNVWRPSRSPGANSLGGYGLSQPAGVSNNLNSFFGGDRGLPMYKDKPFFAPRRTGPRLRRRRALYGGAIVLFLLTVWYLMSSGWERSGIHVPDSAKGEELWAWVQSLETEPEYDGTLQKGVDWEARREKVRDTLIVSWDSYENHGWGMFEQTPGHPSRWSCSTGLCCWWLICGCAGLDEYHPKAKNGKNMVPGGMGWIIVDALDTLMIMNLTSRVQHARSWIHQSLQYNQNHDVNTFETTIRMLGGLLSAHYLSTTYPNLAPIADDDKGSPGEDLYIEKATDLADRILGAFDSNSGVPFASVNLNTSDGIPSHADNGASSTAEATTVQLEFKYLAKLTGEAEYWRVVEKVMQVVDDQHVEDGLVPIFIYADTGKFRGDNIRLGSRGDSYYGWSWPQ